MRVHFSVVEEFLEEITKECASPSGPYAIDDQILRLTYTYKQDPHIPLAYLSVVASVVVRGKVLELHQYVGEIMTGPTPHEGSTRIKAKAEIIRANIEAKARELQLDVRAGIFSGH